MPIQATGIAGRRSAADLEQQGGGLEHLRQDDLLGLEGLYFGIGVQLLRDFPSLARLEYPLQAMAHGTDLRLGCKGQTRQPTDHSLHQWVIAWLRLAGYAEGTGSALDEGNCIGQHGTGDAGQGGQVHRLIERGQVGFGAQLALGEAP
ncbi:hypothetical protein D3C76_1278080 [compost metagenome]